MIDEVVADTYTKIRQTRVVEVLVTSRSDTAPRPDAADSGSWLLGDRRVHRLGLGAMRLTGTAAFHGGTTRDRAASIALVRRAIELGINHIDTAAFYFSALRSANNAALAPLRGDTHVLVATKVGPRRDRTGQWERAARPDELRGDVEGSSASPGIPPEGAGSEHTRASRPSRWSEAQGTWWRLWPIAEKDPAS